MKRKAEQLLEKEIKKRKIVEIANMTTCSKCGKETEDHAYCQTCENVFCIDCVHKLLYCEECEIYTCKNCRIVCEGCEEISCREENCKKFESCKGCGEKYCKECNDETKQCGKCKGLFHNNCCSKDEIKTCTKCNAHICENCYDFKWCDDCEEHFCGKCAEGTYCEECEEWICNSDVSVGHFCNLC